MSIEIENLIYCPSCDAIVNATAAVCSGCGRCLACSQKRMQHEPNCSNCKAPFCNCCGRCPVCQSVRYANIITPCKCGHPQTVESIRSLIALHGLNASSDGYPKSDPEVD
ncbi:MAG: hypothetical protein JWP89_5122 [Schlesneria sp.]|nr:hypothetical protein [Schlesneria sp.]